VAQYFISDWASIRDADLAPGDEVVLGGSLVYIGLDEHAPAMQDLIRQPVRPGSFSLLGAQSSIHSGISQSVAPIIRGNPKVKFSLMLDWYLHYLRRQSKDLVLVGGSPADGETNLEILVWRNRKVVLAIDKHLPSIKSIDFAGELQIALDDVYTRAGMDAADVPVKWCFPLEPLDKYPGNYSVSEIPREAFKRVRFKPAMLVEKKQSPLAVWRVPTMMAVAGGAVAFSLIAWQWQRYTSLQRQFDVEVGGFEDVYKQGASQLELLRSREMLLQADPQQKVLLVRWKRLVSALSHLEDAQVQRVFVFSPSQANAGLSASGRTTDFEIDVDVPAALGASHRVQAKRIMTELAQQTGYSLWLRSAEMEQTTTPGVRRFLIEGVSQ
ncbi:hypothetical protein ACV3Y0_23155, partial [Pseudomonas aeruginosa]